jgi:hypothetical protein
MMFAIVFELQKDQISEWCWGSCGKGVIGALTFEGFTFVACRHADCPHLDREKAEPFGEVEGELVFLRKLQSVDVGAGERAKEAT